MTATTRPRARRSADDARDEILDVAERLLIAEGPAGIRLQEVASAVGVSHPAVLHHFGSREALVQAVVRRAVDRFQADVVAALAPAPGEAPDLASVLERIRALFAHTGHARVLAWLALEGVAPPDTAAPGLQRIIQAAHAVRGLAAASEGLPPPSPEDTSFAVLLFTFALFGEAILGPVVFPDAQPDPAAPDRFRAWLSALVHQRFVRGPGP